MPASSQRITGRIGQCLNLTNLVTVLWYLYEQGRQLCGRCNNVIRDLIEVVPIWSSLRVSERQRWGFTFYKVTACSIHCLNKLSYSFLHFFLRKKGEHLENVCIDPWKTFSQITVQLSWCTYRESDTHKHTPQLVYACTYVNRFTIRIQDDFHCAGVILADWAQAMTFNS